MSDADVDDGRGDEAPGGVEALEAVVRRLRDPESGCPWDMRQTLSSMAPYLAEEAYEAIEAAEASDADALADELGDVLYVAAFLAQLAGLSLADCAARGAEKLTRRHPHVFTGAAYDARVWERDKREQRALRGEGADASALAGLTRGQAPLALAAELQRKAARAGFDWPEGDLAPVVDKLGEELDELRAALRDEPARASDELGDLLFAAVNVARHVERDAGQALRGSCRRFEARFRRVEQLAAEDGAGPLDARQLGQLEALWRQAKAEEREAEASG